MRNIPFSRPVHTAQDMPRIAEALAGTTCGTGRFGRLCEELVRQVLGCPALLVTSRAAPEDRQRGREVGAQGYIVKSEFDQAELLTIIRPLMG